jgi:putative endopeptidase
VNWKAVAIVVSTAAGIPATAQQAALKGIEVSDMGRSVKPCDDFYDYANGAWRAQNPIPASMDRWSRRWKAGEDNKDQLRKILEEVSAAPEQSKVTPSQLTGDFYVACTNVKAIDSAGITPLKSYLAAIDGIQNPEDLQKELAELQAIGVQVPFSFSST